MRYDLSPPTPTPSCDVAPQCELTLLTTPTPLPPTPTRGTPWPTPGHPTDAPVCTVRSYPGGVSIKFCA